MNREAQRRSELAIFRSFLRIAPLEIDKESVEQPTEPHPDIHCVTWSGVAKDFEIVEVVDPELEAHRSLEHILYAELAKNIKTSNALRAQYSSRQISVSLDTENHVAKQDVPQIAAAVAKWLEAASDLSLPLPSRVTEICIDRVNTDGDPLLAWRNGNSYKERPLLNVLREKFLKTCVNDAPVDLIIHFPFLVPPGEGWLDEVNNLLGEIPHRFVHLWFFDSRVTSLRHVSGTSTA